MRQQSPNALFLRLFKLLTFFTSTVFFIPLLEYQVALFICNQGFLSGETILIHSGHESSLCLSNSHIFHVSATIFSLSLFLIINFSFKLLYFEPLVTKNAYSNRENSDSLIILQLFQICGMFVFSTFHSTHDATKLILFLLAGSQTLLYTFSSNCAFFLDSICKLWRWVSVMNSWTTLVLCLSFASQDKNREVIPLLWISGSFCLTLLVLSLETLRVKSFTIPIDSIKEETEYAYHIDLLLRKIFLHKDNEPNEIEGYFHLHRLSCLDSDCPSRRGLIKEPEHLIAYIEYIFEKGFFRFTQTVNLQIQYAYYQFEYLKNRQKAVEQIAIMEEQGGLSLQEGFKLHRLKRFIENEVLQGGELKKGVVSLYQKQKAVKVVKNSLEQLSQVFLEFWNNLLQGSPEFKKALKLGVLIRQGIKKLDKYTQYLEFGDRSDSKILETLSTFWYYVACDYQKAEKIIDKLKRRTHIQKEDTNLFLQSSSNLAEGDTPIIMMGTHPENFGAIFNLNSSAAAIFGYTKNELLSKSPSPFLTLDRKVTLLMPKVIREFHNSWVLDHLKKSESGQDSRYLNNERFTVGQHKSHYLIPLSITVREISNTQSSSPEYAAIIHLRKKYKIEGYILSDSEGYIEGFSAGVPSLLQYSNEKFTGVKDVTQILKGIEEVYFNEKKMSQGQELKVIQQQISGTITTPRRTQTTSDHSVTVFSTPMMVDNEPLFYILWIEKLVIMNETKNMKAISSTKRLKTNPMNIYSKKKGTKFYFYFDPFLKPTANLSQNIDVKSLKDEIADRVWDSSALKNDGMDPYQQKFMQSRNTLKEEGIKLMRLVQGRLLPRSEKLYSEDSEELVGPNTKVKSLLRQKNGIFENSKEDEYEDMPDLTEVEIMKFTKEQSRLQEIISLQPKPLRIKFLKFFGNFIFIFIYLMACIEYFYSIHSTTHFMDVFEDSRLIQKMTNNYCQIALLLHSAPILVEGGWPDNELDCRKGRLVSNLKEYVNEIKEMRGHIAESTFSNKFSNLKIKVKFKYSEDQFFTLNQISEQLIGKIVEKIQETESYSSPSSSSKNDNIDKEGIPMDKLSLKDPAFYFILRNTLNSFLGTVSQIIEEGYVNIEEELILHRQVILAILLISVVFQVASQLILTKTVNYVSSRNRKFVSMFLEIPDQMIKSHAEKVELFMLSIQQDENLLMDVETEGEEQSLDNEYSVRRKKKLKIDKREDFVNLMRMYFFGISVISYCLLCYYYSITVNSWFRDLNPQHKITNLVEREGLLLLNGFEASYLQDTKFQVLGEDKDAFFPHQYVRLVKVYKEMIQYNLKNINLHSKQYLQIYDDIMYDGNKTQLILTSIEQKRRKNKSQPDILGSSKNENHISKEKTNKHSRDRYIRSIEAGFLICASSIRKELKDYYSSDRNALVSNKGGKNSLNKNNFPEFEKVLNTWNDVMIPLQNKICSELQKSISKHIEYQQFQKMIIFSIFLVLLSFLYFAIWIPSYITVSINHRQVVDMVRYLPPDAIKNIKGIRVKIKKMALKVKIKD